MIDNPFLETFIDTSISAEVKYFSREDKFKAIVKSKTYDIANLDNISKCTILYSKPCNEHRIPWTEYKVTKKIHNPSIVVKQWSKIYNKQIIQGKIINNLFVPNE